MSSTKCLPPPRPPPDYEEARQIPASQTAEGVEKAVHDWNDGSKNALEPAAVPAAHPSISVSLLSRREREIVMMLSNGYAALNIAARLNLAHATVRNHIYNVLHKLEVHTRAEAVALSIRSGWI
jgi:DNA-binding CsgD family transcriptional regulator